MKEIKIDLKRIFEREKQPFFKAEYEMEPQDLGIPADVGDLKEPVKVKVFVVKNPEGEGYRVNYTIEGGIDLSCSRCLETFTKDLGGEHSVIARRGFEEKEHLTEGDMNTYPLEGDTLNLTELVREQIILDVPYKPLCHPECGGISYDGEDTERKTPAEGGNNPFKKLKDLLKR